MTWHLKDREIEKSMIKLFPDFLNELNKCANHQIKKLGKNSVGFTFFRRNVGGFNTNKICFNIKEIEDIPEYNPKAWNEFPAVTPPEGVVMRVISICGQCAYRECAIFDKGAWKDERDGEPINLLLGEVKRFRPWDGD